jgi:hypothetical protein
MKKFKPGDRVILAEDSELGISEERGIVVDEDVSFLEEFLGETLYVVFLDEKFIKVDVLDDGYREVPEKQMRKEDQ